MNNNDNAVQNESSMDNNGNIEEAIVDEARKWIKGSMAAWITVIMSLLFFKLMFMVAMDLF